MSQPRLAAIAILGLATLTAAGLALQQYHRAQDLAEKLALAQAAASKPSARSSPAPLPRTDASSESPDELAPAEPEGFDDEETLDRPPREDRRDRGNNPRRDMMARMEEMMKDPEIAAAMQTQQRARLDGRYADLFAKLNLPPAQLNQLKDLLAEKQNVPRDVISAARAEGMGRDDRDDIRALIQLSQEEIENDIRATIGDQAYETLNTYEQTSAQRNMVSQLADRLSYTGAPLNSSQSEALVTILAETGSVSGGGRPGFDGFGGGRTATITDATLVRAQGVLGTDQMEALRQIQTEQAAAATVRDAMRGQLQGNPDSANRVPEPPPPGSG